MEETNVVEHAVSSDIEEIQEVLLDYPSLLGSESDEQSDDWVRLHLDDESASGEEFDEPVRSQPTHFLQRFVSGAVEVAEDRNSSASQLAPHSLPEMATRVRSPSDCDLAEPSVEFPVFLKKGGLENEHIHQVDQSSSGDIPEFEEIDGNFDTKSLDSDGDAEGSSQLFSGSPVLTENFHSSTIPSSGEASDFSKGGARMKRSSSFQHNLDFMIACDQNSTKGNSKTDGDHATTISALKAGDFIGDNTSNQLTPFDESSDLKPQIERNSEEKLLSLSSEEGKKAVSLRKRKNLSLYLEDLDGDHVTSSKKYNFGKNNHAEEYVAVTVRDSEFEGSVTKGKDELRNSVDEDMRTMSSTIAELNNTINLISAENIRLRTKLSIFHQQREFSAKAGAISAGQPLQSLPMGGGTKKVFPYGCNSTPPIPKFLLLKGPLRNNNRIKNIQAGADAFDVKKLSGFAAVGFCFLIVLFLPLNWRPTLSQNMKRGDTLVLRAVRSSHMQINRRDFSVPITEMEQICKNNSIVNLCISGREPDHGNGMSGGDQIMDDLVPRKKRVAKNIMSNSEEIQETHTNSRLANRRKNRVSPVRGGAALPRKARRPLPVSRNYILAATFHARTGATAHSAELGLWKRKRSEEKSKQMALVVKTSRALQDVGSFKKTLLKLSKRFIKAKDPRVSIHGLPIQKAPSTNRKLASTTKNVCKSDTSGYMQQGFLREFGGNMLSTGICTELFRYKMPAVKETHPKNSSFHHLKKSNEKQCDVDPLPLTKEHAAFSLPETQGKLALAIASESSYNYYITMGPAEDPGDEQNRQQPSVHHPSTVLVSVIAGSPTQQAKESKNGADSDHVMQVFVVVLVDGVDYVTYSCLLPFQLSKSEVVTGF